MNKTLSIGLAGFSFIIEEHAYIKLSDYLAALRNSLDANEVDEVMHDIEIRMVEIFRDTLDKREVINNDDVERVIAQIGKPEQIEEQEEAYFSEKSAKAGKNTNANTVYNGQKQLFRDPSRQKIAGVCAGLAHYTGLDITLMRALWLGIAILGIFTAAISTSLIILIYLILWAVLPKAVTASDFLKMEGKPANFDNLKEQSNKIVQFANESTQRVGEIYTENKPYINKAGNGLWNVFRYILGAFFALMAVGCILGLFAIFGITSTGNPHFHGMNEMDFYFEGETNYILKALITLGTLLPAVLFGYLAIKLLSPKTKIHNFGYVLGGIFLSLLALGTYFGVTMAQKKMNFKGQKEDTENIAIAAPNDSIFIDVKNVNIPQNFTAYDNDLFSDKKTVYRMDYPSVDITRKDDVKSPYLIIKKDAEGYNLPMDLKVPVEVNGNQVILPNFIQYPYENRFRDYHVQYELVVPKTAKIIEVKKDKLNLNGDKDGDGKDDNNGDDDNTNASVSINTGNGNSVIVNSNDKDSIIVNGKKYPKAIAEKMMDSMKADLNNAKDVNISIKNGKKEISIKTK